MSSTVFTLTRQQITSLENAQSKRLQKPIQNLTQEISQDQVKLSAWGKISSGLKQLDNALDGLSNPSDINNRNATSNNTSVATVSVDQGAAPGRYDLSNVKLAQTQSVYSPLFTDPSSALGSQPASLTVISADGAAQTINIDAADMTLSGVAEAINKAAGIGITAHLIGDSNGQRLVITGNKTGSDHAFTIQGTGALAQFDYDGSSSSSTMTLARSASDASLKINGVPVTNSDNELTNAIPGGTITLTGPGSTQVSVSVDASRLSGAVSTVISSLQASVQTIDQATHFAGPGDSGDSGPLLGAFGATNTVNRLVSALSSLSNDTLSARDIGIKVDQQGQVSFDESTFKAAYAANPNAVNQLVLQLHDSLDRVTSGAIGENGRKGTIDAAQNAIHNDVDSLNSQIQQQTEFATTMMKMYDKQFNHLLAVQNSFTVTSSYLSLLNQTKND